MSDKIREGSRDGGTREGVFFFFYINLSGEVTF